MNDNMNRPAQPGETRQDQTPIPGVPKAYCPPTRQNHPGLTKREYAAIHLRVPDSGDPELDRMIAAALDRRHREILSEQALARMPSKSVFLAAEKEGVMRRDPK